ncbi:MAG: alanine racemase [Solitalea-like symbiont of Tyrophagus putrescentiae]
MITIEDGINNCTIINVGSKHNINKLIAFIKIYASHKKCVVIITDPSSIPIYQLISEFIDINLTISIANSNDIYRNNKHYSNIDQFIGQAKTIFNNDLIVILNDCNESIVNHLQKQLHEAKLLINLNNIEYNLDYFKSKTGSNIKIMAMVKADGYGLDNNCEIAAMLQTSNIDYLGVTYIDEGIFLRQKGIKIPIMLLVTDPKYFNELVQYNIEPAIYSFDILHKILEFAKKISQYPVHIKIDTGMHRLGFLPHESNELIRILKQNPNIVVKSIFSHLAASDEITNDSESFSRKQINTITTIANNLEQSLGYKTIKHIANTEAVSKYPEAHLDMVRIGKGLYGLYSYNDSTKKVATLKTTIAQIKDIPKNDTIGYNRATTLTYNTKIAIIKIGYADGYTYKLSEKSYVLIKNQKANLLGKVCMDLCMVDVTNISCNVGDEVILFNEDDLSIEQIADWKGSSAYEVITSISRRVKRIYIYS